MKAAWINDIHLEFLDDEQFGRFLDELRRANADCILLCGDIAQAPSVVDKLRRMDADLPCPIHFVLGNHDYYYGSVAGVRRAVSGLCRESRRLHWLNESGVTMLTEHTALVGHDGWGDGRWGDFHGSQVQLNDFLLIEDLSGLSRGDLLRTLNTLGDEAAAHFRNVLPEAVSRADHIVVLTHVPPFAAASWYGGKPSDPEWLPFFACKAAGDVMEDVMRGNPQKNMTVLCGHTHGGGVAHVLPNLTVHTGRARYRDPTVGAVFEWA